ncbi:MAG: hypothetical protein J7513_09030 [Solirubrobacteraceae bacterium]|nr:hypothetical protein [Solirubrobacteraceae bacterium]
MWGPVGSAEAGVSAGSAGTFKKGSAHGVSIGSKLGKGPAATELNLIDGAVAQRLGSCSPSTYGTSFTTTLGSGWSSLAARSQTCTSGSLLSYWTGGSFKVTSYTAGGQNICRGGSYSYGSSWWYKTSKGWVWSGGTSNPVWNTNC